MKYSKKDFYLNFFIDLLENKPFLGFFSVNNFKVQDKIDLKLKLNKIGFDFKVLKNGLFINAVRTKFPQYIHIEALSQGFSIVIFPLQTSEPFKLDNLKDLGMFLKTESNLLFLGGLYDKKLINKTFLKEVLSLKSSVEVYSDLITTIQHSQRSILNSLNKGSATLVSYIKEVDSSNK